MRFFLKPSQKWVIVLLVLSFGFVGLARVEAADGMRGDRCVVAEEDYIAEDFYFVCRILEVRGTIDGDLLGVASNITIERTGVVTGDLFVGGGRLVVDGTVGDDIHFAGVSVSISDKARFTDDRIDLVSAALSTEIAQDAAIPGDLLVYGYQARVNGTVGGDIDFGGEALIINGAVNGRVDATVGDSRRSTDIPGLPIYDVSFSNPGLRIGDNAYIGGDVVYESPSRSLIPEGAVEGEVTYKQVGTPPDITKAGQADDAARIIKGYLLASLRDVLTLLIVGVLSLVFVPDFILQPAQNIRRRTVPTVGWGLIAFMLSFPAAIMLLVFSLLILVILIVIKLNELSVMAGLGLLVVNMAAIGGFWFLLLFVGRVVISFVIGQLVYRFVLRSLQIGSLQRWVITLLIGAVIYALITNIPVPPLGLVIELVTALAGIGALVMYLRNLIYASRIAASEVAAGGTLTPPPPPEDVEVPLGMENLPEGFTGFDD